MRKFEEYYVAVWCLFMPVTSLVLIPAVQGTIVPYMMALASIGFVMLKVSSGEAPAAVVGYVKSFIMIFCLWTVLVVGSQIGDMINPLPDMLSLYMISGENEILMRASMFTQSLYLLACVMIALYFRYFFPEKWMKYAYLGGWFFVVYGLYDWVFFLVFQRSGDFIANRSFANGDHPGSWTQTISFGGLNMLRLKSCLGEPSFVAAVVIPYLLMAIDGRKRVLTILLLVSAILTTSTTVYLGMATTFLLQTLMSNRSRGLGIAVLTVFGLSLLALAITFPEVFNSLFGDKFNGDNDSGKGRLDEIGQFIHLYSQFDILNWIFGIGFGYTYFSLAWALTANTGILGDGSFLWATMKPAYLLPREPGSEWLKISMITLVVVILLSVSELFIPTTWMFIGLAHRRLDMLKARPQDPTGLPSWKSDRETVDHLEPQVVRHAV